jgi:hypothetical protein
VREFFHWSAANDGELIYTKKELQAIEKGIQGWVDSQEKCKAEMPAADNTDQRLRLS